MPETQEPFRLLAIALGLGLLVGLQRERGAPRIAGIRTFPLITIFGTICALLASTYGAWLLGAGLLGVVALAIIGNLLSTSEGTADPGITTEVAMLLMFLVGAMLVALEPAVGIAVGAGVAVVLHAKRPLHTFARRIGDEDFRAIAQFAVISMIILPLLPDRAYGPYNTLNPYTTWLMVVLVVGISLLGYLVYKFLGQRTGTLLGGVLGGAVSSTATTVSYSRRCAGTPGQVRATAVVLVIACVVVDVRVLVEIGVVAPNLLASALVPIVVLAGVSAAVSVVLWLGLRDNAGEIPEQSNPSELKSALVFGGLYALVRLAAAAGKEHLGDTGLYAVAAVSGLTDMDAITISTARMFNEGSIDPHTAWRVIVVAILANLVFKAGIAGVLGGRRLLAWIAPLFGVSLVAGGLLLWLWPAWDLWSVGAVQAGGG